MKYVLSIYLKVDNVGTERMSSGRLFRATGPAKNARLPSCNLRSTGPRSRDSVGRKMCALQIPELNCTYIDIVIVSRAAADARLRDVVDGHR